MSSPWVVTDELPSTGTGSMFSVAGSDGIFELLFVVDRGPFLAFWDLNIDPPVTSVVGAREVCGDGNGDVGPVGPWMLQELCCKSSM